MNTKFISKILQYFCEIPVYYCQFIGQPKITDDDGRHAPGSTPPPPAVDALFQPFPFVLSSVLHYYSTDFLPLYFLIPPPLLCAREIQQGLWEFRSSHNKFASLGAHPDDVEESWISFSHVIHSSAEEVIGPASKVRKPWLTTDTIDILEEKAKAKIRNNTVERKRSQRVFKARAKHDRGLPE